VVGSAHEAVELTHKRTEAKKADDDK